MACTNHVIKFMAKVGEEHQIEVNAKFHRVWCQNNVFCFGSSTFPRWKLSPLVNDLDDQPRELSPLYSGFPFSFSSNAHHPFQRKNGILWEIKDSTAKTLCRLKQGRVGADS